MKNLLVLTALAGGFVLLGLHKPAVRASFAEPVTFNNQIVRLLQGRCQVCHHTGDIAPFSFMTYGETKLFAEVIHRSTESREMPPWKAVEGCSEFDGERRLSDEEIALLGRWVEEGTPEGDPADLPPPLQFTDDWPLGTPDLVLQPEADFEVRIGDDVYRCFSLPTDGRGDRFLSAIDIKPGARSVVHHAALYLDEKGESQALDAADPAAGFNCPNGAEFTRTPIYWWMPGDSPRVEAEGAGWRIPKGASLVLKIHYHVHHGGGQKDRTRVGLYYARQPITRELRALAISNTTFTIPAGDPDFRITASYPPFGAGQGAHVIGVAPHMQLLGRQMEVEAGLPGGSTRCLIDVDEWDSHWQGLYRFKEAVALPVGTRLTLTAHYDNSENNSENPNFPPEPVRYGERTEDETCVAYVPYMLDAESRELSLPRVLGVAVDPEGQLMVSGKGFLAGADIEIDGKRLGDTRNHKNKVAKRLLSVNEWKALIASGRQVAVTVLNPDGVRSSPFLFSR